MRNIYTALYFMNLRSDTIIYRTYIVIISVDSYIDTVVISALSMSSLSASVLAAVFPISRHGSWRRIKHVPQRIEKWYAFLWYTC